MRPTSKVPTLSVASVWIPNLWYNFLCEFNRFDNPQEGHLAFRLLHVTKLKITYLMTWCASCWFQATPDLASMTAWLVSGKTSSRRDLSPESMILSPRSGLTCKATHSYISCPNLGFSDLGWAWPGMLDLPMFDKTPFFIRSFFICSKCRTIAARKKSTFNTVWMYVVANNLCSNQIHYNLISSRIFILTIYWRYLLSKEMKESPILRLKCYKLNWKYFKSLPIHDRSVRDRTKNKKSWDKSDLPNSAMILYCTWQSRR